MKILAINASALFHESLAVGDLLKILLSFEYLVELNSKPP